MGRPTPGKHLFAAFLALCTFAGAQDVPFDYGRAAAAAIAASDDIRSQRVLAELRRGEWLFGFRAYLPTLSVSAGESDSLSANGPDSFSKTFGVSGKQLLWDGGRLSTSRTLEEAEMNVAASDLERTARELGESAVDAYRTVLAARQTSEIRKETLDSLREQRRIMDAEAAAGRLRPDDLAEADIDVDEADIALQSALLDVRSAENSLLAALGLEDLPPLSERIAVEYEGVPLDAEEVAETARARNPQLSAARFSVDKRRAEARSSSVSWFPTLSLTGSYRIGGDSYPLTERSWNVGFSLEFSGPWAGGSAQGGVGGEGKFDSTASDSVTVEPFRDPASALSARRSAVALDLETRKYADSVARMGRTAAAAVDAYRLAGRKVAVARASLKAEERRYELVLLQADMGRSRRVDVMDSRLEVAKKAIAAVDAAVALIAAERAVEKLMDLAPGALADFSRRGAVRSR